MFIKIISSTSVISKVWTDVEEVKYIFSSSIPLVSKTLCSTASFYFSKRINGDTLVVVEISKDVRDVNGFKLYLNSDLNGIIYY